MAIRIEDLKLKEVRKVISVTFEDNKTEQITIYNPLGEKRQAILELMSSYATKNTPNATQELTKEILKELTDLKVYKKNDIEDIVSNPRGELLMLLKEVNEIKTELEYEFWTRKIMEINQATINLLTAKAMEKATHLHELSQDLETQNDLEEELDIELSKILPTEDVDNG